MKDLLLCKNNSLLFVFVTLISLTIAVNEVRQIDVKTADCDDCGMSAFGQLSIKVHMTPCGNIKILLVPIFYVKLILGILEVKKVPIFTIFGRLKFTKIF